MENKKYTSYAQIDRELEILKVEKEISYQKLVFGVKKTKENFTPQNIVSDLIGTYSSAIPYGAIVSASVPFVLNKAIPFVKDWFAKRKRGS
ncbi:DUF6327 family protein [Flavobacterium weaverense]|uniref:Uncharacterized protein n=1 Tax=Flavobacterium weaverense TaxID=271156 RepID=A0A3M0A3A2_9FLAO|nr:DUF6327 family protein [Flavobacterium weaverense]RMA77015.1 hypothetical protein BC961_0996 [Flavobacterium weaverense]